MSVAFYFFFSFGNRNQTWIHPDKLGIWDFMWCNCSEQFPNPHLLNLCTPAHDGINGLDPGQNGPCNQRAYSCGWHSLITLPRFYLLFWELFKTKGQSTSWTCRCDKLNSSFVSVFLATGTVANTLEILKTSFGIALFINYHHFCSEMFLDF